MRYLSLIFLLLLPCSMLAAPQPSQPAVRYVALGDSYTIGTGARQIESWPAVITKRLQKKGVSIELVGNLARAGWTTEDLINYQLPELKTLQPDFVSVLIGVNDWVRGTDIKVFENNLRFILDELVTLVPDRNSILVVTIPDFSVMPAGDQYSGGRDVAKGIAEFNDIVRKEAELRQLQVVDIYPLSQTLGKDFSLYAIDGLHPSAKAYALWADFIESAFRFQPSVNLPKTN